MSEIKNVGLTWMALNALKSNHVMPLHFKGLILKCCNSNDNICILIIGSNAYCVKMAIAWLEMIILCVTWFEVQYFRLVKSLNVLVCES